MPLRRYSDAVTVQDIVCGVIPGFLLNFEAVGWYIYPAAEFFRARKNA